jgi:hypothetical protein
MTRAASASEGKSAPANRAWDVNGIACTLWFGWQRRGHGHWVIRVWGVI